MLRPLQKVFERVRQAGKTLIMGPQILAFLPALLLGGYWFGGEAVLRFLGIAVPMALAIVSIVNPGHNWSRRPKPLDPATKLPFRAEFLEKLDQTLKEAKTSGLRTSLVVIEVDGFDNATAMLSSGARSALLARIGRNLQTVLREPDLICRLDGASFAIALCQLRRIDLETMIRVSARLQEAVAETRADDDSRLAFSATVGFAIAFTTLAKSAEDYLAAAGSALARAKASGPGTIRSFAEAQRRKRPARNALTEEVDRALDKGEFRAWFQPQLSTDTGDITGMEALARWEHPSRGIVQPGVFLPAIAAAGLNERLGEAMIYQSLSAMHGWTRTEMNMPSVGVNFSGDELANPAFADRVIWELDKLDLDPPQLTIEVPETAIRRPDASAIARNVSKLSEFGCQIDLDDFGNTEFSVNTIRRLGVTRIKIDRSFVSRIDIDRQQQDVLTRILDMAQEHGVSTIAEGVETIGEHALLAQLGCEYVQGFSIAKPLRFEDTFDWINAHRRKLADQPRFTGMTN